MNGSILANELSQGLLRWTPQDILSFLLKKLKLKEAWIQSHRSRPFYARPFLSMAGSLSMSSKNKEEP